MKKTVLAAVFLSHSHSAALLSAHITLPPPHQPPQALLRHVAEFSVAVAVYRATTELSRVLIWHRLLWAF